MEDAKYAYIQNGSVWVANNDWQSIRISQSDTICSFPRFNREGNKLVWTIDDSKQEFVCYLDDTGNLQWLSGETTKSFASFSPNGKWLTYQSDDKLVIYNFESGQEFVIISSGIDLVSPAYWVTSGLNGRIYFANGTLGQTNLYWVSPRKRTVSLGSTELIVSDCEQPFWVGGVIGGIMVVANERSFGNINSQKISIVTNVFSSHFEVEIEYGSELPSLSVDGQGIKLALSEYFGFEAAAVELSGGYGAVYLTNRDGIYLLDSGKFISESDVAFNDVFMLLVERGSDLDINPAW